MGAYFDDDGEWFELGKGFRHACCSCHLVHDIGARTRDGKTEIKFTRNERATSALRRKIKRKVVIVDE